MITMAFRFKREADRLLKEAERARKQNLMRMAAAVRTTARKSLKHRKGASKPGQVPFVHAKGSQNLRKILFAWQPSTKTVIVGPIKFPSSTTAVQALEHGGRSRDNRRRVVIIKKRPTMVPAMKWVMRRWRRFWKDTIGMGGSRIPEGAKRDKRGNLRDAQGRFI